MTDILEISALSAEQLSKIERLREAALHSGFDTSEYWYLFWKSFRENSWTVGLQTRYAKALSYIFENVEIALDPNDLIPGRISSRKLTEAEEEEYKLLREWTMAGGAAPVGQESHMAVDYELLMKEGLCGIAEKIDRHLTALDLNTPEGLAKQEFFGAAKKCLDAVVNFAHRYADAARELAKTASGDDKAELELIADDLQRVPEYPPESFLQAVRSAHFVTFCLTMKPLKHVSSQYQLGRPDRYLYPFYERDIKSGRLTPARARLICDALAISINRRVPHGLSCGYMVGGRRPDGSVVSNDLTRLLMNAVADTRLVYPSVGFCVCADGEATPDEDINLACKILASGRSHPAFFNDDVIRRGLMMYGVSEEESCLYIHSTCVEITPANSSNVWVASPYHNLVQTLLDTLKDRDFGSTEEILGEFYLQLANRIRQGWRNECLNRYERTLSCDPLLSCFVNDCLAEGVDIERGGARYNWIMPSFVGLSNVCDALAAIEELVFGQKRLTLGEIKAACAADFKGAEEIKELLLSAPKYGNDDDTVDRRALEISDFIKKECEKYSTPLKNGRLVPSMFCWIMHDYFGQATGASPDGRNAGFPLGDGSGPAQGRERKGPTASLISSTKWDHAPFIGGVAVNIKFSKSLLSDNAVPLLAALARGYLKRGGFELQINVTDRALLLDAVKNPQNHRDLVVRIGGYSDYFVTLSKTMQAEVLARTEHQI